MILAPRLRARSRVALVAPAGPLPPGAVERAAARVSEWGWEPVVGENARGRLGYLSGNDDARAADFDAALRDPHNDAIWSLRGGYGVMRIVDRLDWGALAARPRPVIGFSDNTAIHLAIQRLGLVSFHGPHPATELFNDFSRDTLFRVLADDAPAGLLPFPEDSPGRADTIAPGVAEGPLLGGNLSLLASTVGTPYAIRAEGAILFIEEIGEAAYKLDRLLSQLRLAGVLDRLAGIAIGAINEMPDAGRPDTPTAAEVVRDLLGGLGIPVAMGFPFGHVEDNWTLPMGIRARLDADAGTLELLEAAVA